MRSDVNSPFAPGSDAVPEVWAGRALELADAESAARRRLAGVSERGRAVLGEYGIGKSVLVNRIAGELAAEGHLVPGAVRVAAEGDPLALLGVRLAEQAHRTPGGGVARDVGDIVARVEEITVPGGAGVRFRALPAERDTAYLAVGRLLEALGRAARDRDRLLLVRIDEVQNARPQALSRMLTVLGDALDAEVEERDVAGIMRRRKLPLLVYLSGLPDFRDHAHDAGATFARRFKALELDLLEEEELQAALSPFADEGWPVLTDDGAGTVHMEPGAIDCVVGASLGDPFLFQLAGEAAWNAGTGAVITADEARAGWRIARREAVGYVEGRLRGLGELQMAYLRAAAGLPEGERSSAAIARSLGRSSSSAVASTAQALDRTHGLIRRTAGRVRFRSRSVEAYLQGSWP